MAATSASALTSLVGLREARLFIERCMAAVGSDPAHAATLAEVLVMADHRGHFSHGMNRLEMYVHDVKSGTTAGSGEPSVLKESPATAYIDGNNILGPVVGRFCIDLAIKKAKDVGIGWVVAKGSNHFSIAGYYSLRAMEQGMIGMAFTNTSPLVVPTRAKECVFGTNPLACAAPGMANDSFVLDMATSTAAVGKVEVQDRKEQPIPNGWGTNSKGKETNDPKEVLEGGGLMPLGGSEESAGYKGYGLAMMVEVFCGILADSAFGPHVRKWKDSSTVANIGQCFVAINPNFFGDGFTERMQSLMDSCRSLEPAEGEDKVLVPGDPERKHISKVDSSGAIEYHKNLIDALTKLSRNLNVEPLKTE